MARIWVVSIPNVLNNAVKRKQQTNRTKSKSVKQYVSIEELGIPLDLSFLKNIASHTDKDKFATIAECSLEEVRREFLGLKTPLTIKEVKDAISKCTTLKEFKSNFSAEYSWVLYNNREDLVKDLIRVLSKPFTEEEIKDAITKCSTIEEFRNDYLRYYGWIKKQKRYDLIQHFDLGTRFQPKSKLTKEEVIDIISKCSTLRELTEQHSNAYYWCRRYKRMDLYKDLPTLVSRTTRTEEEVIDIISKCSTLKEFKTKYNTTYQWCLYHKKQNLYNDLLQRRGIKE